MDFSPEVERWRGPLEQEGLSGQTLLKALWTIAHESGGDPNATNPSGATGLFQIISGDSMKGRPDAAWLKDPTNNIRFAVHQLGIGQGNFAPWGENNSFNGQPFGAFGMNQSPFGAPANGRALTSDVSYGSGASGGSPASPGTPAPTGWTIDPATGKWRTTGTATAAVGGAAAAGSADPYAKFKGPDGQVDWGGVFDARANALLPREPKLDDPSTWPFNPNDKVLTRQQQYQNYHDLWNQELQTNLTQASSFKTQSKGFYQLPNGVVVPLDTIKSSNPDLYAAIAQSNQQAVAKAKNDLAIDQSKLDTDHRQATFNNAVVLQDQSLKYSQEARARASYVQDALDKMAPWAAPAGKTSFSPSDLGSLGTGLAGLLKLDPNAPLLNYTGQRTVDPAGILAGYDAQNAGASGLQGLADQIGQVPVPHLVDETGGGGGGYGGAQSPGGMPQQLPSFPGVGPMGGMASPPGGRPIFTPTNWQVPQGVGAVRSYAPIGGSSSPGLASLLGPQVPDDGAYSAVPGANALLRLFGLGG